jgi:hypothetical protein
MARLAGLTGLYGPQSQAAAGYRDEGALQAYEQGVQYQGAHAKPGDTAGQTWPAGYGLGYSGQGTYSDNPSGQLAEFNDTPDAQYVLIADPEAAIDRTPSTHGGLWPRPEMREFTTLEPDKAAVAGVQGRLLHAYNQGGVKAFIDGAAGHEEETTWTVDRYESPDDVAMGRNSLDQTRVMGGGAGGAQTGAADVMHGYGQLNSNPEFQHGHSIRNVQHDTLHFDHSLGNGTEQEGTWLPRMPVGTATTFDGPDSPYGLSGGNRTGLMRAEKRGYPTEYTQPPSPTVQRIAPGPQADVWASRGVGGF